MLQNERYSCILTFGKEEVKREARLNIVDLQVGAIVHSIPRTKTTTQKRKSPFAGYRKRSPPLPLDPQTLITRSEAVKSRIPLASLSLCDTITLVIKTYANHGTEDIALGISSRAALKMLPPKLWEIALDRLAQINDAETVHDFWKIPRLKFEALRGDRRGQSSVRINQRYRICFVWAEPDAYEVEIADYHKG